LVSFFFSLFVGSVTGAKMADLLKAEGLVMSLTVSSPCFDGI